MNGVMRYIVSSESIGDSVFQPWTFGLLDTPKNQFADIDNNPFNHLQFEVLWTTKKVC